MKRNASAVWNGNLKDGSGKLSTGSGALQNTPYAFANRFENTPGTNPEELVGAAHAGCFSMALANTLAQAGKTPNRIHTQATVTFDKDSAGWTVQEIHLDVTADVPDATPQEFEQAAKTAKETCPISRLLKANITMTARLGAAAGASA